MSSATASKIRSASATTCARSESYVPILIDLGGTLPFASCSARARPASAFSSERARKTVGMPAEANTAPDPDPMAPLAPSTTILRMGLMVEDETARRIPLESARNGKQRSWLERDTEAHLRRGG